MKNLFYLLLLSMGLVHAQQTTYSDAEIRAVAGNRFEYLIVGDDGQGDFNMQMLLNKMGFSPVINPKDREKTKWVHSNRTNGEIVVWLKADYDCIEKGESKVCYTKWVDLYGDAPSIIKFYVNFWSKALNFRDTKPGETVTVRFLSDVAALTVNKDGTAIIKVRSAKDYYKD
ncbi:hypothetical protein [Riemerella anatipestifer]|uniref:hypothetical protein n=1 Tax=Riemerella anatipestifer TaxID=34085 RepID=UPI003DA988EC